MKGSTAPTPSPNPQAEVGAEKAGYGVRLVGRIVRIQVADGKRLSAQRAHEARGTSQGDPVGYVKRHIDAETRRKPWTAPGLRILKPLAAPGQRAQRDEATPAHPERMLTPEQ